MPRDDEIYRRGREFMCRCFGNCDGCPIAIAARRERLRCGEFQKRFPERDKAIVADWRRANLKLAQGVKPDPV